MEEKMAGNCREMNEVHELDGEYPYRIVINWKENGMINSAGKATIENDGGIFIYSKDCKSISSEAWNGGGGRPDPLKFTEQDGEDKFISLKMSGAVLDAKVMPPRDLVVMDENKEDIPGWSVDWECGKDYNSCSFGECRHYRNCWFKTNNLACDNADLLGGAVKVGYCD